MQYHWEKPIRALTIRGINPDSASAPVQLDLFNDYVPRLKQKALDDAIDEIRNRYGTQALKNTFRFLDLNGSMTIKEAEHATNPLMEEMPMSFHGALA